MVFNYYVSAPALFSAGIFIFLHFLILYKILIFHLNKSEYLPLNPIISGIFDLFTPVRGGGRIFFAGGYNSRYNFKVNIMEGSSQ